MGYFGLGSSGSQRLTADGVVGTSGKPTRVFTVINTSGTAGTVNLHNGTSNSDALLFALIGTANTSKVQNFEDGLLFPAGCYADLSANVSAAVIEFVKES